MRCRLIIAALAAACGLAGAHATAADAVPARRALIYGDSIMWESSGQAVQHLRTWGVLNAAYPGYAPCDWLPRVASDLATFRPTVVAVETVGNLCAGTVRDTPAYYAQYTADLTTITQEVSATGAHLVFIAGPPIADPTWDQAVTNIIAIETQLATQYPNVTVDDSARNAVSNQGIYTGYLPCQTGDTRARGCTNHLIAVRTVTGPQTGLHLCPPGLAMTFPFACPVYSSGERRFGTAVAATIRAA